MSSRYGRNLRRRARAVAAELADTQLALGQAVTGMCAVGDPSRGFPSLSSLGVVTSRHIRYSADRYRIEKRADVSIAIYHWNKLSLLLQGHRPIVAWQGVLWHITSTTPPREGEYVGGPAQFDLELTAIGFNGQPDGVMPMTATRWNEIKQECMA